MRSRDPSDRRHFGTLSRRKFRGGFGAGYLYLHSGVSHATSDENPPPAQFLTEWGRRGKGEGGMDMTVHQTRGDRQARCCWFDQVSVAEAGNAHLPSAAFRLAFARLVRSAIVVAFFLSVSSALAEDCPPKTAVGKDEAGKPSAGVTIWTTGSALMPGWGLYPNGQEYDGTKPLGSYAAWRSEERRVGKECRL